MVSWGGTLPKQSICLLIHRLAQDVAKSAFSSLIPVPTEISPGHREEPSPQIFQDQRETAHASPSGGGCETCFASMIVLRAWKETALIHNLLGEKVPVL